MSKTRRRKRPRLVGSHRRTQTQAVALDMPKDLWVRAKVEARAQGKPLREVIVHLVTQWLEQSPAWHAYLAGARSDPLARARGPIAIDASRQRPA